MALHVFLKSVITIIYKAFVNITVDNVVLKWKGGVVNITKQAIVPEAMFQYKISSSQSQVFPNLEQKDRRQRIVPTTEAY